MAKRKTKRPQRQEAPQRPLDPNDWDAEYRKALERLAAKAPLQMLVPGQNIIRPLVVTPYNPPLSMVTRGEAMRLKRLDEEGKPYPHIVENRATGEIEIVHLPVLGSRPRDKASRAPGRPRRAQWAEAMAILEKRTRQDWKENRNSTDEQLRRFVNRELKLSG